MEKRKFGIAGCGFLGSIVANAYRMGLLGDYNLSGVTSRTISKASKIASECGCPVFENIDALLDVRPDIIAETAGVGFVRDNAEKILSSGCSLAVISIGAFADETFYNKVLQTAYDNGSRLYLASGAVGGFDVLLTAKLMAEAKKIQDGDGAIKASICTHTGAVGFKNTPVWNESLLTGSDDTKVFEGTAKEAIAKFPWRTNVAVASSLASAGPDFSKVTMFSVPGWKGDDHCINVETEGVKAVVDICSPTSAVAGWSMVAMLRNIASPVCFF